MQKIGSLGPNENTNNRLKQSIQKKLYKSDRIVQLMKIKLKYFKKKVKN